MVERISWLQQHVLVSRPNFGGCCLELQTCFGSCAQHFWAVSISQTTTMTTKGFIN
jgi:hypothetical protein